MVTTTDDSNDISHGIWLRNRDSVDVNQVVDAAVLAEEAGWDGVFLSGSLWEGWTHPWTLHAANDICPKCSAVMDHSVELCEDHHVEEGVCGVCGNRHAVHVLSQCTNCIHGIGGIHLTHLIGSLEPRRFVAEQGLAPIIDGEQWAGTSKKNSCLRICSKRGRRSPSLTKPSP